MERLDKLLSSTGRWSRKEAEQLIRSGRVTVDGVVAARREEKYPDDAVITVDREAISAGGYTYLMLNKPAGLVSATEDPRQATVLSLLPEHLRRVGLFPAGRLDRDTVGLLLLTNDGPLAHALLSPVHHVDKIYLAEVEGVLEESDEAAFREGMVLQSGLHCLPAGLERLDESRALVTLHEGKYHQIKRMLAARKTGPISETPHLRPAGAGSESWGRGVAAADRGGDRGAAGSGKAGPAVRACRSRLDLFAARCSTLFGVTFRTGLDANSLSRPTLQNQLWGLWPRRRFCAASVLTCLQPGVPRFLVSSSAKVWAQSR